MRMRLLAAILQLSLLPIAWAFGGEISPSFAFGFPVPFVRIGYPTTKLSVLKLQRETWRQLLANEAHMVFPPLIGPSNGMECGTCHWKSIEITGGIGKECNHHLSENCCDVQHGWRSTGSSEGHCPRSRATTITPSLGIEITSYGCNTSNSFDADSHPRAEVEATPDRCQTALRKRFL